MLSLSRVTGMVASSRRTISSRSAAYAFSMTYGLARLVDRFVPLRISPDAELQGVDLAQHGESAYALPGAGRLGS